MTNINYSFALLSLIFLTSLPACTLVKLTPGAENIRIVSEADVASCRLLGRTTTSVKAKAGLVTRNPRKVNAELDTLARNAALNLHGDTLVPNTDTEEGQKTYKVYQCNHPEKQ